jgi:FKBP-type peptidyl-prolyl cis-trans isomerase FkpA
MKKYFLLLSLLIIGIASCKKETPFNAAQQAATDDAAIQAYIAANKITATKDPSGLYYSVLIPGTGDYPTATSTVNVNYTGTLLNGTVFQTLSNLSDPLPDLIKGWQIGIPHVNVGGRILLMVPSALGYGNTSSGSIPANSVLIFTIDLLSFTN